MSFLKNIIPGAVSFVRRMTETISCYAVQDVDASTVNKYKEVLREELLTMYQDSTTYFAVIRYPATAPRAFIVFQGLSESVALECFTVYSFKLQTMIHCYENMMNKESLQAFLDVLREHPNWSLSHIVAKLKLFDAYSKPEILQSLNDKDEETGVTPLLISLEMEDLECIKELIIRGAKLNVADKKKQNIFHYAVKTHNETIIHFLASKDRSSINDFNSYGESALHDACSSDQHQCVEHLLRWGANPLITGSKRYPIHCAMKYSSEKCARQLCKWNPDQVNLRDHKYGGTPLHWAKKKECVMTLCDFGCDMEARSNTGDTALHVVTKKFRYDCAMGMIIRGADAGALDNQGNTTIHMAIETDSWELVQLMTVFGADVNLCNKAGISQRHLAATRPGKDKAAILYILHHVGAQRCKTQANTNAMNAEGACSDGCRASGNFNGTPSAEIVKAVECNDRGLNTDKVLNDLSLSAAAARARAALPRQGPMGGPGDRILSLDGGGIRGLILMQILKAIEKFTGQPIKNCFDWMAGSSTGAILALFLIHGRSVRYCQGMYFELKNAVFTGNRPYSSEPLEAFLQKELGATTRMSEVEYPKVIVTAVLADRFPADLHLFRNYEIPGTDGKVTPKVVTTPKGKHEFLPTKKPNDQLVWMAARASGAAPTYFRAHGRFVDGGLMANNPTLDILTEVYTYNTAMMKAGLTDSLRPIHVMVSLGTGCMPVKPAEACDVFRPGGLFELAKVAVGAKNLAEMLIEQATSSDGRVVERAAAWCSMIGVPFYRFSPQLSVDFGIDCNDDRQLVSMLWETQAYINDNLDRIKELATLILP